MKYIITESQYNLIKESKKYVDLFQTMINGKMEYIQKVCDNGAEDYDGDVGHESCNQLESISKIDVTDADWVTVKHSNRSFEEKFMSIRLMVYYSSNRQYGNFDADDITYDLEQMLRKSTGMPIIVNYDSTNTNKSFDW